MAAEVKMSQAVCGRVFSRLNRFNWTPAALLMFSASLIALPASAEELLQAPSKPL